jgi:hypothetical protein
MTPLDLLASHPIPTLTIGYTAWYVLLCTVAPWGRCRRCNGTRTTGRLLRRPCRRCNGTGIRVRLGRRVYRYIHAEYLTGNPATRTDRTAQR